MRFWFRANLNRISFDFSSRRASEREREAGQLVDHRGLLGPAHRQRQERGHPGLPDPRPAQKYGLCP